MITKMWMIIRAIVTAPDVVHWIKKYDAAKKECDNAEIQLVALIDAIHGYSVAHPETTISEFDKIVPKILNFAREE